MNTYLLSYPSPQYRSKFPWLMLAAEDKHSCVWLLKGCFLKESWALQRNFKARVSPELLLAAARSAVKRVCSAQCRESNLLISSCGKEMEKTLHKGIAEEEGQNTGCEVKDDLRQWIWQPSSLHRAIKHSSSSTCCIICGPRGPCLCCVTQLCTGALRAAWHGWLDSAGQMGKTKADPSCAESDPSCLVCAKIASKYPPLLPVFPPNWKKSHQVEEVSSLPWQNAESKLMLNTTESRLVSSLVGGGGAVLGCFGVCVCVLVRRICL